MMNNNKNKNLAIIYSHLIKKLPVTTKNMTDQLGCSTRTFREYIKILKEEKDLSISIYDKVFYRLDEEPETAPSFSKEIEIDDVIKLNQALKLITQISKTDGFEWMEETLVKLTHQLDHKPTSRKIIYFDNNTEANNIHTGENILSLLKDYYDYIENKTTLSVEHNKTGDPEIYTFSPHILKQFNNRWFLFGTDHGSNEMKKFSIDRIVKVHAVDDAYIDYADERFYSDYFDERIGVSDEGGSEEEVEILVLDETLIPYLKTKPMYGFQKMDGNRISMRIKINYELESQILSHGEKIKVIRPEKLIKSLRTRTENMRNNYV